MKIHKSVIAAIIISAAIRITILLQTQGVTYTGYEDLVQIQHIADTGIPLNQDPTTWGGAHYDTLPLYHYLAALTSILLPIPHAALLIANLAALTIPIAVYALAKEVTTQYHAPAIITIASAFTPLLYAQTTITANPIALAIPLFLGAYYYFLRLGKTPRDQVLFVTLTTALAITHALILLLAAAMLLTLVLKKIQAIRFNNRMAEATLYTTFLATWVTLLFYQETIANAGLAALIQPPTITNIGQAATLIGVLTLLAGTYAVATYIRTEENQSAHALTALAITTALATITGFINTPTGLLLLSLSLIALTAGAIKDFQESKHRTRLPRAYSLAAILLTIIFLATTAVPAITLGFETLNHTPTTQEHELMQELNDQPRDVVHWDQTHGDYLRYHGFGTASTQNTKAAPNSQETLHDLQALRETPSPIRYIEILNEHDIRILITNSTQDPITERCFERLETTMEAYRLRCVVA